jgi:hypothetical protein
MKKGCILVGLVLLAVALNGISVDDASGRPQYFAQFKEHYKGSKIASAVEEVKCLVCHYGKLKKDRNDYGTALSKHLNMDLYKKLLRDKEGMAKTVDEALIQVEKEKSVSGTTFGKLIEEGRLPGTAPEGQ